MHDFCIEQKANGVNPALVGEILGGAGVNIEGLCLMACEEMTVIHFTVADALTARQVLEKAGIKIRSVSEVFVYSKDEKQVTGKPGSFGGICRILADHGIKINFGYPAENNRFVFGVDDVEMVRELLNS